MRPAEHASLLGVALLAMVAASAAQQVFTNLEEYNRKKAEYDRQKAKYDEYQSIANVPVLAGYDLIAKGEPKPGTAEQLLPVYDGKKIDFKGMQTPFFTGNIPSGKTVFTSDEPAPAPKPAAAASGSALFFGRGAAPSQPVELRAAAPAPASAQFAPAPFRSFEGSSSASNFALKREQQAQAIAIVPAPAPAPVGPTSVPGIGASTGLQAQPLRPLAAMFQFAPSLPFSDFHPGPERNVGSVGTPGTSGTPQIASRVGVIRPALRYGEPRGP